MLIGTAKVVFFVSAAALCYTYAGYPLVVWLVSLIRPKNVRQKGIEPTVSFIITAYNEERDLRRKLENTLSLDYPKEKIEIIVASDGSTDQTDEIVKEYANQKVKLLRVEGRLGKTAAQNAAVEIANNEIILFSDATTIYQPEVLYRIVRNFADETVGCVAGKLIYVNPGESSVGDGARSYWNYETFIKTAESRACSLIGVSGCLYAVRRKNYVPMYPEACSDFLIATKIRQQNLRTIYEPEAVAVEETNIRSDKELKMRVRVIAQTFTDLWRHRRMLNPLHGGFYAVELFSHKVMRYSVPLFLILLYFSNVLLAFQSPFFDFLLLFQLIFYVLGVTAWLLDRAGLHFKILTLPLYFVLANAAVVIAFYKFLRGERFAAWQPVRDAETRGRRAEDAESVG